MSNASELRRRLHATEWKLEAEQETIAEIERVCEEHGYGGEQTITEWLRERLAKALMEGGGAP